MGECQCGERRCPATFRHVRPWTTEVTSIRCKHGEGHEGDHAGYAGFCQGDVSWPREAVILPQSTSPGDPELEALDVIVVELARLAVVGEDAVTRVMRYLAERYLT